MDENLNRKIDDRIKEYMKSGSFTNRKITDNPTENLALVNRRYVNLNGTTTQRPSSSVASLGQQFFDTDEGFPVFWNGSEWVDAQGNPT